MRNFIEISPTCSVKRENIARILQIESRDERLGNHAKATYGIRVVLEDGHPDIVYHLPDEVNTKQEYLRILNLLG
jgi:hypothetical protein